VLHRIKPRTDQLLEEWQVRTTGKQRLTPIESGPDRELVQEDYPTGVTLVRDYLREVKRRKAEVFKLAALLPDYDAPTLLIWEMWVSVVYPSARFG